MRRWFLLNEILLTALFLGLALSSGGVGATERNQLGVVVLHGKWDSPDGHAGGFAGYLRREGFQVVAPEMPWSGRRAYDQGAAGMVATIDQAVAELKKAGAKKIFLAGHSQGAAGALYYASQQQVNGIILIAAGGHAQGKTFIPNYAPAVADAKARVAEGKATDKVAFIDLNTGNRTRRMQAPAQSVVDYFDPDGPFNTYRSAAQLKPDTAVLILIPSRESEGLKRIASTIRDKLPAETKSTLVEIDADHLSAPDAAKQPARDWLASQ